jgi:hypothetical protein
VNKSVSYNNKRNTIMIVMIMVLETTTTVPQLNNKILQILEHCELAIGVGQRATDFRITVQKPAHK